MKWRRAGRRDLSQILSFLLPNEWRAVPFTSRLCKQGRKALPTSLEASVLICREDAEVRGAMMLTSTGLLLPCFSPSAGDSGMLPPAPFPGWSDLKFRLFSIMGPSEEVGWLKEQLAIPPLVAVDYHLMRQNRASFARASRQSMPGQPGLLIRTAFPRDVNALLPLQIRYELEEVVINKQKYSEQVCRQNLKRALRQQIVLMAEQYGEIVAKAGTNARGFTTDQIGGVYTVEKVRNSGIAFRVMEELLRRIYTEKPTACLFVKKDNLPALSLYRKLGFRVSDGYQICYFKT
jgi:ribosomal protein S18 acetylase RimI-like enzyme